MVYAQGIGQWLTGGDGINDGSRQSELEKMMPISIHDASFSMNDGNGDEVTTALRRARPKAGDDTVASR
uniref:Uncharacterized protein n=1 Tax=Oryza meridionalis TaxID=40149 RepID=A0A0E0E0I9_9ORYZ